MKDILGLVIVTMGASIFGRGFEMLSPDLQTEFAKEMYEKMIAFLTQRTADGANVSAESDSVGGTPRR
jgi:hypothetical protein